MSRHNPEIGVKSPQFFNSIPIHEKLLADTIGKHSRRDGNISLQRRFGCEGHRMPILRKTSRWIGGMGGHLSSSGGVGRRGHIAVHSLTLVGNAD
jgi:hypothetical protein